MSKWVYKIQTLKDAPKELFDLDAYGSRIRSEELDILRLGIFCEESSHQNDPWFIASFVPNYRATEQSDHVVWTVSNDYKTGTGHLIRLAYVEQQLLAGDTPKHTSEMTADELATARSRWTFECKKCGLRQSFRNETFQAAVTAIMQAGIREISITGLQFAVKRFAK